MKQVHKTKEIAHMWANGIQPLARNPQNNFFYDGKDIFSYRTSYIAGRIYFKSSTVREQFALVNSDRYSVTTAKHLRLIRDALRGNMPHFSVPDPADLSGAVKHLDQCARDTLARTIEFKRPLSKTDALDALVNITRQFSEASKLRKLIGRKPITPASAQWKKATAKMRALVKRHTELNSPSNLIRKEREREKRAHARAEKLKAKLAGDVAHWKNGGHARASLRDLPFDLLKRVDQETVETSRSVRVPFERAERIYFIAKRGIPVDGEHVGGYSAHSMGAGIVKVGCHKFRLEDVAEVFEP